MCCWCEQPAISFGAHFKTEEGAISATAWAGFCHLVCSADSTLGCFFAILPMQFLAAFCVSSFTSGYGDPPQNWIRDIRALISGIC